jgi:hypothetical protein
MSILYSPFLPYSEEFGGEATGAINRTINNKSEVETAAQEASQEATREAEKAAQKATQEARKQIQKVAEEAKKANEEAALKAALLADTAIQKATQTADTAIQKATQLAGIAAEKATLKGTKQVARILEVDLGPLPGDGGSKSGFSNIIPGYKEMFGSSNSNVMYIIYFLLAIVLLFVLYLYVN